MTPRIPMRAIWAGTAVLALTLAGCSSTPPTPTTQGSGNAGGNAAGGVSVTADTNGGGATSGGTETSNGGGSSASGDSSSTSGGGGTVAQGAILQVYRGASGQFVENYNPLSPTVLSDVDGLIYERLFYFDNLAPLGTPPTPELGKSYKIDSTGKIITVELRDGVKWSDGQPFSAKDVVYTFNAIQKNPALNTSGTTASAKATGDSTVTLTFDKPVYADAPNILMKAVVPEHIFSKMKDIATDPNKNPVGTGPMKLDSFTAQSYSFAKSPTFRDADKVPAPGIRFYSLSGNEAATNKLLAGQLDWTNTYIPDVEKVLKAAPDVHIQNTTTQQVVFTTCSNAKLGCTGPQTDPAVRQAMAAAIDRDQVNKLAYYGRGIPISPTFALAERDKKLIDPKFGFYPMQADVGKAKSIMEAAGWKLGSDGIYAKNGQRASMEVIVTAGYTDYISALDVMKPQLQKAGIEITPQQKANAEILNERGLGKFQVAIDSNFQGPVGDPYYIYNGSFSSATVKPVGTSQNPYGNVSKFSDPTVDAAIVAAGQTNDIAEKAKQYAKIQDVIVPSLPYVPVINNQGFAEYSEANYTGWKLYAAGGAEQTLMQLKAK